MLGFPFTCRRRDISIPSIDKEIIDTYPTSGHSARMHARVSPRLFPRLRGKLSQLDIYWQCFFTLDAIAS
ncbi:hypothetical protein GCM10026988_30160 [Vibrio panuliri]